MRILSSLVLLISLFFTSFLEASEINNQNIKKFVNQFNDISYSKKKLKEILNKDDIKKLSEIEDKWDDNKIKLPKLEYYNNGFKTIVQNEPIYFSINYNYELQVNYRKSTIILNEHMPFDSMKFLFRDLLTNTKAKTSFINLIIPNAHAVAVIDDVIASAIALSVIAIVTFGSTYYMDYKNNKARNEALTSANNLAKSVCATLENASPEQVLNENLINQYNEFSLKLSSLCTKDTIENNSDRKEICNKSMESKKCIKNAIDKSRTDTSSRGNIKKFDFDVEKDQYQKNTLSK